MTDTIKLNLLFFILIPPYILSVADSPNNPVGFDIKITISNAKVNASEKAVHPSPFMIFSHIPIINAPTTAPGIEPMPPNTAATKAFNPGIAPDVGTTPV